MSDRALKRVVGALAVVVAAWVVVTVFRGGSGSIAATGELASFFDGIDGASVQSVRMTRGDASVLLERSETGWSANGFPADSGVVSRFLEALDDAEVGDLIATNPANHDRMGVSNDSARVVEFSAGSEERSLLVGKSAQRFGTAYVRLPGADEVYLLDGDLRAHLDRGLDAWRDRTIVAIDTASVARIVVERGGTAFALVRGDSAWTFDGGGPAAGTAVDGVLSELARMVATGFLEETDSLSVLPQAAATTALSATGDVLAEITFGDGEGDRWARASATPYLYRVSSFRANRVAPERASVTPDS